VIIILTPAQGQTPGAVFLNRIQGGETMKRSRLIIIGLMGVVLAAGLTGCKIISASPNPNVPLEYKPDKFYSFKVEGPIDVPLYPDFIFGLYKYQWVASPFGEDGTGKTFDLGIIGNGDLSNKIEVTCGLLYKDLSIKVGCGQAGCPPPSWERIDSRTWTIIFPKQDPPVWKGSYLITNEQDAQMLQGFTEITGSLSVYKIQYLNGLESLTSVGGNIKIGNNYGGDSALTSLSGLENLTSVGGDLWIVRNKVLTSLSGLKSLTSVGGNLYIQSNPALTTLGMTDLQKVGGYFDISYNSLLCISLVEELRDQVLTGGGIGGGIDVSGNKVCTMP
jgi:hypothetical protein